MCDSTSDVGYAASSCGSAEQRRDREAGAVAGGDSSEILMVPGVHPFTAGPGRADPPGHKTEAEQEMHPGCSRLRLK